MKVVLYKANDSWHFIQFATKEYKSGDIQEVCKYIKKDDLVYLLQVSDFIREYDNQFPQRKLPTIVEIESFSRQFWQKSKPLETQEKWNLFKFLKENDYLSNEFRIQDSIEEYLIFVVDFIEDALNKRKSEELSRFENIEIPINSLIYHRQRIGISIDETIYCNLIQKTEEELYDLKNQLQLRFKIYNPDDVFIQLKILKEEGLEIKGSLWTLFKSRQYSSEICKLLYQMLRAEGDLKALLYLTAQKGGKTRTFPSYHGFGSISSRITLREPALQNLRKKTRKIIKPDEAFEFIYVDYSQFEAGILASLSNDEKLMKLYDADIYEDINLKVWEGKKDRNEAKILFYKYMYGMDMKLSKESNYFKTFTNLNHFKKLIEDEIITTGKVGSSNGNYRILSSEDQSIALSHRIQSEASLIFKESLLKVNKLISEAEFILPMHDAALYQVNTLIFNKKKVEEKIKKVFKDVFAIKCPGISHCVKIKNFYEE